MKEICAEVCLPTQDLRGDIGFFNKVLGMRMNMIYPADDPAVAVFSGHGLSVRLDAGLNTDAGQLLIRTEDVAGFADGERALTSPGGTLIAIEALHEPLAMPETIHSFVVRRLADQAPWVIGRAGMHTVI